MGLLDKFLELNERMADRQMKQYERYSARREGKSYYVGLSEIISPLFNDNKKSTGATPPPPPGAEAATPAGSGHTDWHPEFSDRLNSLIDSAVLDGKLTETEVRVLRRTAEDEGQDWEEVQMVVEARLYKRNSLGQIPKPEPQGGSVKPEMRKCPCCGAPFRTLSTRCPECGCDYLNPQNASKLLAAQLAEIDERHARKNFLAQALSDAAAEKAQVIARFPVPTTSADIVDLFTLCCANSKYSFWDDSDTTTLAKAYRRKAEEILLKAGIVLSDRPDLFEKVRQMAKTYKIK